MLVNVPDLDAQQAGLQTISIGQVSLGPIGVGTLVVDNVDVNFNSGPVVLYNVVVSLTLDVKLTWHIHISMPWPLPDINIGGSADLGSPSFGPFAIGDVTIPTLSNVNLNIPSLTASNTSVTATPLYNLQVSNAAADTIKAQNVKLPSAGFTLAGLLLGSINGSTITVPAASIDSASVDHLSGPPIDVAQLTLGPVTVPTLNIPSAHSTAALNVPVQLSTIYIGTTGDIQLGFDITPSAQTSVAALSIANASANATVSQILAQNLTIPYDAHNLTLSTLGINNIAIPSFAVA